jgi:hypothetical protein
VARKEEADVSSERRIADLIRRSSLGTDQVNDVCMTVDELVVRKIIQKVPSACGISNACRHNSFKQQTSDAVVVDVPVPSTTVGTSTLASPRTLENAYKSEFYDMATCTAPVNGHRTASGAAACPACSSRARGYASYSSYSSPYHSSRSPIGVTSGGGSTGGSGHSPRPRWSRAGSSIVYTPTEVRTLTPVREHFEKRASLPDLRDVFLCHAWDDRKGAAKELHDLLEAKGVSVWFSEKDVLLGSSLLREIDKGLAKSRVGIVLVTPALLLRVAAEGIADKELSALLARDLLVPIVHDTTYEALREVSPLLGSRSGLSTAEEPIASIAAKLAELLTP